ncbi:HEPN domain-containing protein [Leptolyngbya ohadii]|uniref:HEPN domain-containing protein n=1 Tax=Leptolyngbya ohadii TaxID=1962290 RepID=UPI000B5A1A86|nr:HEPN domain-containing protein [Leptolyngbya ohadii]
MHSQTNSIDKKHLEGCLGNLLKKIKESGLSLSQYIDENREQCKPFVKALYKNRYISENYFLEDIIEILEYTYTKAPLSVKQLIDEFESNLVGSYNEWAVIFPLNYSRVLSRSTKSFFRRSIKLGRYTITPARDSIKGFREFCARKYQSHQIEFRTLEHQIRVTNGHLLSSPLLSFHIHGSFQIAQIKSLNFYNFFLWMQNLHIALLRKRLPIFGSLQDISAHYFLLNLKNGEINRIPINIDENRIFSGLSVEIMRSLKSEDFNRNVNLIFSRNDKLFWRIYNSLHFFSKGFSSTDDVSRLLFYVISLESIFSKDKNTPLRATLADYVSLLCALPNERIELHRKVQKLYDVRSSIVHQGVHHISYDLLNEAEYICAQAIFNTIEMYAGYEVQGDLEKRFFDDLLRIKLIGN